MSRLSGTLARWGRGTSTPLIERLPAPIGGWPRCLPRPDHQCVALRRGQWRSLEALQMPEHSDAILADAPPGVPRAGECGAPSLGRPADLVSGDPPRPRPRRAWPPAEPCDGRRGSATAPRFLEEHASVLELRYLRLRHLPICSPFPFVGQPSILLRIGCPPNSSLPRFCELRHDGVLGSPHARGAAQCTVSLP